MQKQGLLFVTQTFPQSSARQTGGTISNLDLLRTLARDRKVSVLSFDATASAEMFASEPFDVIHMPSPGYKALGLALHWNNFVRSRTRDAVSRRHPETVMSTTATLAALDCAPPGSRRVAVVRAYENFGFSCPYVPMQQRISLAKQAVLRRLQDARLMREADAVFTNSKFMKQAIAQRFGIAQDRIQVLVQACDAQPSTMEPPEGSVGFVHRGPEKNIALVVEMARRTPELRYLVYGHDSALPDTMPPNVDWRGWSARDSMFASARVWLVPSLWAEPFGRVSIEAQSADRAVVVAKTGGLPETVLDRRFLLESYDPDTWVCRLREVLRIEVTELRTNGAKIRQLFGRDQHDLAIHNAMAALEHT